MTIILDGTKGTTTPGLYSSTTFTGTYADGIVVDYTSTLGRISVGTTDGIAFYNGGVATTELMRLDSSGNLGIGTSSPVAKLQSTGGVLVSGAAAAFTANSGVLDYFGGYTRLIAIGANTSTQGAFNFATSSSDASVFNSRMIIDSSGNVGIGTSSPSGKLQAVGSNASLIIDYAAGGDNYYNGANHIFRNNAGTERARINSSGNLLVGTTTDLNNTTQGSITVGAGGTGLSNCGQIQVNGSTASGYGAGLIGYSNGTNVWGVGTYGNFAGGTSTFLICKNTGGGVYLNGASATSWTAVSDETRKVIIEPISDAANKVSTLRAVIGRLKTDEDTVRRPYLIAQDVQAVLPEAVSQNEDWEGPVLGLSYTEVIPLLVAAIKEQQAIITQLQADVAQLKGQA